ncbi:MAG: PAS domain-containing protein, partial [Dissulfurispiraceae bacterium]
MDNKKVNIIKHWHDSFDVITDLVSLHDKDFNIIRANRAFLDAFDKTQESVFGIRCYQLVHKTAVPIYDCPLKQSAESRNTVVEEIYEPALGLYLEVTCYPLFDDKGEFEGVLHFARDITERRQAVNALKRNEENLNRAQNVAHVGSWLLDIDNNALWWSDETYRMFGVPSGTPLTLESFFALIHPEDVDDVVRSWEGALAHQPYDVKHRIIMNGNVRWVNEKAEIIFNEDGRPMSGIGTVQDITELRQAEDALKRSEANFRILIENIPDRIFLKDMNSVYMSCNDPFAHDQKIVVSEIAGKTDYDFFPEEHAEKYRADDKRIMETGEKEEIEEKYILNGSEHFAHTIKTPVRDSDGNIVAILGIFRDITERKHAESELKLHSEILENMAEGVFLIRTIDGKIVYTNKTFECMFGYGPGELVGKHVSIVNAPS